jgi:phenylalanyl-tRNA synthetase beta subunit
VPSRYPGIAVDTTLEHPRRLPWTALAAEVDRWRPPELREFGLKDRFEGDGVAQGSVRTTLWFSYQSSERSLTQEEVNRAHAGLTERLARRAAEEVA